MLNCLVVGLGSACYGKVGLGKVIYHGGLYGSRSEDRRREIV